ncbi:MAG: cytochrome c oxidase subunit 3 [Candidatus Rokuibacteriota bacterium]
MPIVETEIGRRGTGRPADGIDRGGLPPRLPRDGDGGQSGSRHRRPPLSNARLGVLMLLAGEVMFFGGLVGAFLVLRLGASVWPPPGQPRLPLGVTTVNTLVLLLSSYTLARALQAGRVADRPRLVAWLARTASLGTLFLAVQGFEWFRLVHFGLTVSSGIYGAAFYTVIGAHGVHVLGALGWLTFAAGAAARGRYHGGDDEGMVACAIYWHFVVALWPILYVLIYLA